MRNPKLLLLPLVPVLAIGIVLVARELDAGSPTTAPSVAPASHALGVAPTSATKDAPSSFSQHAPPPVALPCGPNCGADA